MAARLKTIARFSVDAIEIGLNSLPPSERKALKKSLDNVAKNLGQKQQNVTKKNTSNETIFRTHIIKEIEQKMDEFERREVAEITSITWKFEIVEDFAALSIDELKAEHKKILQIEGDAKQMLLLTQFMRGKLYINFLARKKETDGRTIKQYIAQELEITPPTVYRYMTLSTFLLEYPRLIICNLSFAQIILHKKRMQAYFEDVPGLDLAARLMMSVEITINEKQVKIERIAMQAPAINFNTSPDAHLRDQCSAAKLPNDEEIQDWVNSARGDGKNDDDGDGENDDDGDGENDDDDDGENDYYGG